MSNIERLQRELEAEIRFERSQTPRLADVARRVAEYWSLCRSNFAHEHYHVSLSGLGAAEALNVRARSNYLHAFMFRVVAAVPCDRLAQPDWLVAELRNDRVYLTIQAPRDAVIDFFNDPMIQAWAPEARIARRDSSVEISFVCAESPEDQ